MIRVLVAEPVAELREQLVHILESDPGIKVVAQARDGTEAVEQAEARSPDLVLMAARMPRLDGCQATAEIMVRTPRPIVIVSSGSDDREIELSLNALQAGALLMVERPDGRAHGATQRQQLVGAIKAMAGVRVVRRWASHSGRASPIARRSAAIRLVAVATSTGGPAALRELLSSLPRGFEPPIVVVQHMAAGFISGLAEWLSTSCDLRVVVPGEGEALRARTVYLAPDNHHLGVVANGRLTLSGAPPVEGFRPSATYLFESVARAYGAAVAAVVLTGMGRDGVDGLHAVRAAGGRVLAQDEASCVVYGMPQEAVRARVAEATLPIPALAARLVELAGH